MTRFVKLTLVVLAIAVSLTSLSFALPSGAEAAFPERPVNLVVPWPAGGRTDLSTRVIASVLQKELGVPVVVSNKTGGGGIVGAQAVASSRPDGYTIGVFSISHIMSVYTKIPPMDFGQFDFLCKTYSFPQAVIINAESPLKNWDEVIAYSKEHPGEIKFGHPGAGTADHIFGESLAKKLGVKWTFIPYKGDGPAGVGLASKEIDLWGAPLSAALGLLEGGSLRVLGIAADERLELYPNAPTHKEQGVDYTRLLSEYFCLPKGTPQDRVDILLGAIERTLNSEEIKKHFGNIFVTADFQGPEATEKYVMDTVKEVEPIVDSLGLNIAPKN
ncbi:MAG TPA: tripartite tricarboxylate transporter substrate binding protein [Synergistales bacterium]|nr:tripartite tricarboxylate transporter substrate binding protein [Synergistales bacterium]